MCMVEKKSFKFSVRFAAVQERNKANMCSPNGFLLLKHKKKDKAQVRRVQVLWLSFPTCIVSLSHELMYYTTDLERKEQ
jgi:hypothetical protein